MQMEFSIVVEAEDVGEAMDAAWETIDQGLMEGIAESEGEWDVWKVGDALQGPNWVATHGVVDGVIRKLA